MKSILAVALAALLYLPAASPQCKIAFDNTDDFDSTRIIATQPMNLGFLVVSGNVPEDLEGEDYVEEAKAIFSYSDENNVRSFFLTLGVVERKFYMIGNDYNILLKFVDGTIMKLFNVPADAEFDRKILMWKYMHTCVVPLEIYHMMKNVKVEKIRIVYDNYKSTIALEPNQQQALQDAVKCIGDRLANLPADIKP
ncbi:MAG: hypothetical protein H6577_08570 [Lewinellaceae bacterium]|nr:hypothetical protein [Saprospiraceae bacterium]MCB9338170.1 hypothetical protein [Lewinellaceae bacterium]